MKREREKTGKGKIEAYTDDQKNSNKDSQQTIHSNDVWSVPLCIGSTQPVFHYDYFDEHAFLHAFLHEHPQQTVFLCVCVCVSVPFWCAIYTYFGITHSGSISYRRCIIEIQRKRWRHRVSTLPSILICYFTNFHWNLLDCITHRGNKLPNFTGLVVVDAFWAFRSYNVTGSAGKRLRKWITWAYSRSNDRSIVDEPAKQHREGNIMKADNDEANIYTELKMEVWLVRFWVWSNREKKNTARNSMKFVELHR